jgi:hypothetical protein
MGRIPESQQILKHHGGQLKLAGSKLPTYGEVLNCLLANINCLKICQNNFSQRKCEAAKEVANQVIIFYKKGGIPTILHKSIADKIRKFHDKDYRKCLKVNRNKRSKNPIIGNFQTLLKKTMPFYPDNVEKIMKDNMKGKSEEEKAMIEEDVKFLEDQKTNRIFTFGCKSIKYKNIAQRQIKRKNEEQLRIQKQREPKVPLTENEVVNTDNETDGYSEPEDHDEPVQHIFNIHKLQVYIME